VQLTTALLADAAIATPDGKLYIHGGGIDTILVPRVPVLHPTLALALSVLVEMDDRGHDLRVDISFLGPDGATLMGGRAEARAIALEPQHPHATIVTAYTWSQLPLPGYGAYRVVVDAGAAGRIELPLTVAELTGIAEEEGPADDRLDTGFPPSARRTVGG